MTAREFIDDVRRQRRDRFIGELQRYVGLPMDGMIGPRTRQELKRRVGACGFCGTVHTERARWLYSLELGAPRWTCYECTPRSPEAALCKGCERVYSDHDIAGTGYCDDCESNTPADPPEPKVEGTVACAHCLDMYPESSMRRYIDDAIKRDGLICKACWAKTLD